jgi:two-component system, LytTR family, sensor kinase
MFNSILFMRSFAFNWRQSLIENEQLKQAKLHADYMALQNQLNPHFLFNSFSALISEIQYNPKRAVEFAQKMSDVYRYVLKQKDNTTVELKNEMEFLEDYCYLHKIRMGENLVLNMEIEAVQLNMHLPPMTIQALIENAIKHNKASEKLPLYITIKSEPNGRLSVVNNLNPKSNEYSTGTGLDNICKRYKLLSNELVEIKTEDEKFIVSLPLLNK